MASSLCKSGQRGGVLPQVQGLLKNQRQPRSACLYFRSLLLSYSSFSLSFLSFLFLFSLSHSSLSLVSLQIPPADLFGNNCIKVSILTSGDAAWRLRMQSLFQLHSISYSDPFPFRAPYLLFFSLWITLTFYSHFSFFILSFLLILLLRSLSHPSSLFLSPPPSPRGRYGYC